jgi:VanZ family protein
MRKQFVSYLLWLSATVVVGVVTTLSLLPSETMELPTNDKIGHFLAYAVLSLNLELLTKANKELIWLIPVIILYGIMIEFIQGTIPGRESSFLDILANSTGVLIGTTLFFVIRRLLPSLDK